MTTHKIINAKIETTTLGAMEYGYMSFVLGLDLNGSYQGFGTYDLRFFGIELIERILFVTGASTWENLPGTLIRIVKGPHRSEIKRIGHIIEDRWLDIEKIIEDINRAKGEI